MKTRALFAFALLALSTPACTVHVPPEVGTVAPDGSTYLGWQLFSGQNKKDQEEYPVGQHLGAFGSIRLHSDEAITLTKVVVIMADGERFTVRAPAKLGANEWTNPLPLPHPARPIYSVVVSGKAPGKHLAKLEIYGQR
jgi:hypothetical protein